MIIENLQLTDFRVFKGRHNLDLMPRIKYNKKRPIVLFGGLNGAGKTTILTAIRLGLFGKQALGHNASQKAYEEFLASCIHRSKSFDLQSQTADIEIHFSYANMGVLKQYRVKRAWSIEKKHTIESLTLTENGTELKELSNEQCQGFLNELIPMGVADLFFFDGEKIAELAEDTAGGTLGDAIKKLLGLDLLDTLSADLSVILRNKSKEAAPVQVQKDIVELEEKLELLDQTIETEQLAFEQTMPAIQEAYKRISQFENELKAKGGSWASSREQEIRRLTELEANIKNQETMLRDTIADCFPLAIASEQAEKAIMQLKAEQEHKSKSGLASLISTHLINLQEALRTCLSESDAENINSLLAQEFKSSTELNKDVPIIHDVSDSALAAIEAISKEAIEKQKYLVDKLGQQLTQLRQEHDAVTKNIGRAPVEEVLQPILVEIKKEEAKKSEYAKKKAIHLEKYKAALRQAIEVTRNLEKLTEKVKSSGEGSRIISYVDGTKELLKDFSVALTKQKISELEESFANSFGRLARKGDLMLQARIDHKDFSVQLLSKDKRPIDKNELSAGEKQIYAISILEALARTSGRHLPIIIDTPLGRLDSMHRSHLINHYFPNASHQVVILSTDTEVDEQFYSNLSPHISHAYRLEYSTDTNDTSAKEGYFWKQSAVEGDTYAT